MGIRRLGTLVAVSVAVIVTSVPVAGAEPASEIVVTDLGDFIPLAINNRGQIVGRRETEASAIVSDADELLLWEDGRILPIPPPPGGGPFGTIKVWLNDQGDVAGTVLVDGHHQPFLWSGARHVDLPNDGTTAIHGLSNRRQVLMSTSTDTDVPGQPRVERWVWDDGRVVRVPALWPGATFEPFIMSANGLVYGHYNLAGWAVPATWRPGGTVVPIWSVGTTAFSTVAGMNAQDTVLGARVSSWSEPFRYSAYVWAPGRGLTDVPSVAPELPVVWPVAINDRGHVLAVATTFDLPSGPWHPFLWRDGQLVALDVPTGYGFTGDAGPGFNNHDQILLADITPGSPGLHLYQEGRLVDLGALAGGSAGTFSVGLNDRGQVAGHRSEGGRRRACCGRRRRPDRSDSPAPRDRRLQTPGAEGPAFSSPAAMADSSGRTVAKSAATRSRSPASVVRSRADQSAKVSATISSVARR